MRYLFCFLLLSGFAFAQEKERVKVAIPSQEEEQVSKLLEDIKSAIDSEDLKSYSSFLTKELFSKNKKKTAILFLENDLNIEVVKFAIMDSSETSIEFMASYILYVEADSQKIVSNILAKKTENGLVISKEEIVSAKRSESPSSSDKTPSNIICLDGKCFLADAPAPKKDPKKVGVHLFRNDKGEYDINGVMWLDPRDLVKACPEKYAPNCKACQRR